MQEYSAKHITEYVALRTVAAVANAMPYRAALSFGWINALLTFSIAAGRRREAHRRITAVFGDSMTPREVRRISWTSWRNMVFNGIEAVRFPSAKPQWLNSVFDASDAVETLTEHSKTGRGGVIASPHMGAWDTACVFVHSNGLPLFNIAARQRNPLVNAYIDHLRSAPGIDTIARGSGTMRDVLRKLKNGSMLAILPDVRMPVQGLPIHFLGGEANLGKGMAMFARHADVPIFPCIVTRKGWAKHQMVMHPPIFPDQSLPKQEDLLRMTKSVIGIADDAIRKHPEQWFWFNRRWVLDPIE